MSFIILKASSYFLMIVAAYMLKRIGLTKREHGKALSYFVMKFTLPAAIITSFASFSFESSLLIMIGVGFLGTLMLLLIGIALTFGKSREERILYTANIGYNIGNFSLPFTSSFTGPVGTITTSLFDAGNAVLFLGFVYPIIEAYSGKARNFSIKEVFRKTFSSLPFDAYCLMVLLSVLNIKLPEAVTIVTSEIAKANGPLAMFMIGTMLDIKFDKKHLAFFFKIFAIRVVIASFLSFIISRMTFLPYEAIKAGIIVSWSPMGSVGPAYTSYLGGDEEMASFANTMSLMISIVLIPILAIVL